jgi:outer membrane lipoprotein-sorting protein
MTRAFPAFATFFAAAHLCAAAAMDMSPVKRWIARQNDFHSVTADFTQTRALKALRGPLENVGHLWFKAPDSFRWELGNPAKLIVLRKGESIYLIQPAKKRAERSAVSAMNEKAGAMGLGMMNIPFARDFASFQKQYETLAVSTEGTRCHLEMLPRDPRAHKMLTVLKLDFNTGNGHLLAFEMATRDGSAMRNEFTNVQINAKINSSVFDFDFTGYNVVDAKP